MKPIKLLIVDDSETFRETLKIPLSTVGDVSLVGEAGNGEEAVTKTHDLAPDVVIMDVSMPKMNGLEATKRIKTSNPEVVVLILSAHDNPEYRRGAEEVHADGYLLKKDFSVKSLIEKLETACAGSS